MKVGYARTSTAEQSPEMQLEALRAAGCGRIFVEQVSGAAKERPVLEQALELLREGDTLVVWKLDRLGRSLRHLIELVDGLGRRGVDLRSLQDNIDTATPGGRFLFHVFGAVAEFERDLIRERVLAGMRSARARGRKGGRPRVVDGRKLAAILDLRRAGTLSDGEICRQLGISETTLYRRLREMRAAGGEGCGKEAADDGRAAEAGPCGPPETNH